MMAGCWLAGRGGWMQDEGPNLGALDRGWILRCRRWSTPHWTRPLTPASACLCCPCRPCHPGTPAPAPAPSPAAALSAYVIGPSIWAGSVVIEGRAWGAAPAANHRSSFDSAASASDTGKTRAGATGSVRRRDDTTTLCRPRTLTRPRKHTSKRPTLAADGQAACNQPPAACLPLSQSWSQSQSPSPTPSPSAPWR